MDKFFEWLAEPGPWEEMSVIIIIMLIIIGLPICLKYIKVAKITKQGIEFDTKDREKKAATQNFYDNKHSTTASQDHKLFTLILRDFSHKIKAEIKEYCRLNGLNLKTDEEYKEYTEEKKSVYYSQLKEEFQNEYIAYDTVTLEDIEEILETLRDFTFHRIEVLFKKIRDISIEEHKTVDENKKIERETFEQNIANILDQFKESDNREDSLSRIRTIMDLHYMKYGEILLDERISILDKQIHVIEEVNKSITRRFIEEFETVYRNKKKELIGGTNEEKS